MENWVYLWFVGNLFWIDGILLESYVLFGFGIGILVGFFCWDILRNKEELKKSLEGK